MALEALLRSDFDRVVNRVEVGAAMHQGGEGLEAARIERIHGRLTPHEME